MRVLIRMERDLELEPAAAIPGVTLRPYDPATDHSRIPGVFATAFGREPWPDDWDRFDEFDPAGVRVAERDTGLIGFTIGFRRGDTGYLSVVAVDPAFQRRGIASALVREATGYLHDLGLGKVQIDAWGDSPPAVATYLSLGFVACEVRLETDDPAD